MPSSRNNPPSDHLPLSTVAFHVLLALATGEKHGYGILKEVEQASKGKVQIGASTLYSTLQRLEGQNLITETPSRLIPALDDERRRYYRLTSLGEDVLRAEGARLEEVLSAFRALPLLDTGE